MQGRSAGPGVAAVNFLHCRQAASVIARGGIIAYPTEAVFGLGCAPHDRAAVYRILQLKRRPPGKGLIVVAADIEQIHALVDMTGLPLATQIVAGWPGPLTWLLPARPQTPVWLTGGHDSLAVRVSADPRVRQLCQACGPLVSTSANPAGARPARSTLRVRAYFGGQLDYIVPGDTGGRARPSEIRDGRSGKRIRH